MGKKVTVRRGLNDLYLPNGISYDGGQVVTLSDAQYEAVGASQAGFFFEHVEDAPEPTQPGGGDAAPMYSYDGSVVPGVWTVQPGRNPGSARFRAENQTYSPGGDSLEFVMGTEVANDQVATLLDSHTIRFAQDGLYLVTIHGRAFYSPADGVTQATQPEKELVITTELQGTLHGPVGTWSNLDPALLNLDSVDFSLTSAVLATGGDSPWAPSSFDLKVSMYANTHPWECYFTLTVVRLD